jgi:hypothetical protein
LTTGRPDLTVDLLDGVGTAGALEAAAAEAEDVVVAAVLAALLAALLVALDAAPPDVAVAEEVTLAVPPLPQAASRAVTPQPASRPVSRARRVDVGPGDDMIVLLH